MKCTNCGYENPQGAKFCGKCGMDLMVNHTEGRKKKEEIKNRRKSSTVSTEPVKKKGKKIAILLLSVCVLIAVAVAAYLSVMSHPEKRYERALKTAEKYLEEENYDQAIAKYKQAISIDPKQVEPYRQLAKAYIATENTDAVEETYDTVTGIIVQEYKNTGAVLEETKDVYKDTIDYYGKTGDTEKVKKEADEVIGMLDDVNDRNEVEQLRDFYLMNWGYYNKLQELEKSQGEVDFTSETDEMGTFISCSGLCFAKLVDFNNDGQEELVVAYQMSDGSKYVEEVYGYEEDGVHKLLFGDGFVIAGVHDTAKISVLSKDDQSYLIDGQIIDLYEKDIIYGYENDSFEKVKTIGITGFDAVYSVDDRTVSESTYTSACEKWMDSDKIQNYALADYGTESIITSIEELKNVYETLRGRLNIKGDTKEEEVIQRLKEINVSDINVDETYFDTMNDTEIAIEGSGQNLIVNMTIDHLSDFVKYNGGNIKLQLSDGNIALMFKYTIEDDVAALDDTAYVLIQNNGNLSWMGSGWHEINCEQNENTLSWNITLPSGSFTTENIKYISANIYTSRSISHVSTYEIKNGELFSTDVSIEQIDVAVNSWEDYHQYIE